jgi:hypothetical protein
MGGVILQVIWRKYLHAIWRNGWRIAGLHLREDFALIPVFFAQIQSNEYKAKPSSAEPFCSTGPNNHGIPFITQIACKYLRQLIIKATPFPGFNCISGRHTPAEARSSIWMAPAFGRRQINSTSAMSGINAACFIR